MTAPPPPPASNSFLRRSAALNALFVGEGAANFLQDVVIAAAIGLSAQSDILYAAWTLPLTIGRGMFQSLTNSFMGLFDGEQDMKRAYDQAITVIGIVGITFALTMALSSSVWYPLTVPGASASAKLEGQPLAAILALLVAFLALAETFRAIYYRENRVHVPSLARVLGTAGTILLLLTLGRSGDLRSIAWSIVAGAALETVIDLLGLWLVLRVGFRPRWPDTDSLKEMTTVVGSPLVGQGVRVLAGAGERALASYLGPGALTAVSFASRITVTLERFIFRGFLITTIQSITGREVTDLRRRFRLVLIFALPQAVILATLAQPLVAVAFGRGRFTAEDVLLLASTLQGYAPAILGIALTRIPLALAYGNRQSGVVFGFFLIVSAILIAVEFLGIRLALGGMYVFGIAYAVSLAAAFVWLYQKAVKPKSIVLATAPDVWRLVVLGASVVASTIVSVRLLTIVTATRPAQEWILLLTGSVLTVIYTILFMRVLNFSELAWIIGGLKKLRS